MVLYCDMFRYQNMRLLLSWDDVFVILTSPTTVIYIVKRQKMNQKQQTNVSKECNLLCGEQLWRGGAEAGTVQWFVHRPAAQEKNPPHEVYTGLSGSLLQGKNSWENEEYDAHSLDKWWTIKKSRLSESLWRNNTYNNLHTATAPALSLLNELLLLYVK